MKPVLRKFIIPWLAAWGLPGLLRSVRRWLRPHSTPVMILLYHRLCDPQVGSFRYQSETLGVAPGRFAGHVEYLARHYAITSLTEAMRALNHPEVPFSERVVITFDDGYRDNLTEGLPILRQHGAKATIFLATDFIGESPKLMWNDRLAPLLEGAKEERVTARSEEFSYPPLVQQMREYPRLTEEEKRREINLLAEELKKIPNQHREALLQVLTESQREPEAESRESERLMLTWGEVEQMAEAGMDFGAHTCSHPILTQVPLEKAEQEIWESGQQVAEKLGRASCVSLAFPNGRPMDIPEEAPRILRQGGYQYALSTIPGINLPGGDPFRLKRISVSNLTASEFSFLVEYHFWRGEA